APAAVTGEDEGVKRRVGALRADTEAEPAAHGRSVVRAEEADVLAGSLRDVLAVLICRADVVETDRSRPPHLVQASVELDRVDGPGTDRVRELAVVEVRRRRRARARADPRREARRDL